MKETPMTTAVVAPHITITEFRDLAEKTAVITGGTKGIGHSIVARFVASGATVLTSGRSTPTDLPDGVHYVRADLSTLEGTRDLARSAEAVLDRVDIVVNNAGASTPHMGGVLDIDDDEWLSDLNINFLAAVRLNAALLPGMYSRGTGAIINISSVATLSPAPAMLHYAAAKSALATYTRGLAAEAGPRDVRVNTVTPGAVTSPGGDAVRLILSGASAATEPNSASAVPLNRLGTAGDITEAVAFLASDRAAWITASELVVDGGQFQTV
jgi:NAD(P)-dependent dehydrogenase (short-subunit alcohol dehydrogenase family)